MRSADFSLCEQEAKVVRKSCHRLASSKHTDLNQQAPIPVEEKAEKEATPPTPAMVSKAAEGDQAPGSAPESWPRPRLVGTWPHEPHGPGEGSAPGSGPACCNSTEVPAAAGHFRHSIHDIAAQAAEGEARSLSPSWLLLPKLQRTAWVDPPVCFLLPQRPLPR